MEAQHQDFETSRGLTGVPPSIIWGFMRLWIRRSICSPCRMRNPKFRTTGSEDRRCWNNLLSGGQKFSEKIQRDGNPLCACEPVLQGFIKRCHEYALPYYFEPDPPDDQTGLLAKSVLPGIIRQQHWSWEEQRGHSWSGGIPNSKHTVVHKLYLHPHFVPPFAFLPIHLRHLRLTDHCAYRRPSIAYPLLSGARDLAQNL